MSRLPTVGGDYDTWGTILNDFLSTTVNVYTLASQANPGDSSITLDRVPFAAAKGTGWIVIDPFSTNCEIRRITSVSGATVTLTRPVTQISSAMTFASATKKISRGSEGNVSQFFPGAHITVSGSSSNNGQYTVAGYPTDGSYDGTYITVVENLVDEGAGAGVTIVMDLNRTHIAGARVFFTTGPISALWYGAKASADTADAANNRLGLQRMLDDGFYAQCYDLYLPGFMDGRYYIDAPLYVEKNIHLRGPNQKAAVIAAASTFATWDDNVAMLVTRRDGFPSHIDNGGNDRYYFTGIGIDGGDNAYAKSTGFDASSDAFGTAYLHTGTNTVSIHATLIATSQSTPDARIVYRALAAGTGGNAIRVAHVNDGAAQPLDVTVAGNDITVHLATNGSSQITSTANDVIAAVNADVQANLLVEASLGNEGDQKFNAAGSALVAYNLGTGILTTMAMTVLGAGTAPFAVGDVGRSIYLGMKLGARTITGYTNSSTITVSGDAFTVNRAGLRFAVSPVNGIIGSFNQTAILQDIRIEHCPGYGIAFAGCQEFTVRNLMTLFTGIHRRLIGVQWGHFYDCNMEHSLDAYVTFESSVALGNVSRSNHFIGGHIEDVSLCDYWREEGDNLFEGLYIYDYMAETNPGSIVVRNLSPYNAPSIGITGLVLSGPNDGTRILSDVVRAVDVPMTDFETNGFTVNHLFWSGNGSLDAPRRVVSKTSAYTMHVMDRAVLADAGGAPFSVTLPSAVPVRGTEFTVKRMNSGGNAVTVEQSGSETIDGSAAAVSLGAQYDRITVMSDGANWVRTD